jgi:hypothetical protein
MIKLGLIGLSDGNGHPFSWSAIINGYDKNYLDLCPFEIIRDYLSKRKEKTKFINSAEVTHVWTQSEKISESIAKVSRIKNIEKDYKNMIGKVDAVLLARDDFENHFEMSKPFIEKKIPIYIDKPLAISIIEAEKFFKIEKWEGQIFTCSSLKYAEELNPKKKLARIGKLRKIIGIAPKSWFKYSVHIIEPVIYRLETEKVIEKMKVCDQRLRKSVTVFWKNGLETEFITTGNQNDQISLTYFGSNGNFSLFFSNPFDCFKKSLEEFCKCVQKKTRMFRLEELFQIIRIIETVKNK